ncbi:MAG TPA: MarR family transcriptional regulator [Spirochaetia bacterium]|nr:MarR family transcriptional regulator [Spirochaetaceae bacterium]HPE88013.1 MarR family transcriptional regulator [Spirochaetales bacterium]HRW22900.1 MarR family transcriptional regulator [Spirochaetia bacterium]
MIDDVQDERPIAERLFEAFRAIGPFKRRPTLGHAQRPGEFQVMHRLSHEPPGSGMRVGDLAAWLSVKPPTVTKAVDALAARGLVERYADEADRRAIRVRLSPEGRKLAGSFREQALGEIRGLVEYLGDEESATLARLLTRAADFMNERYGRVCRGPCPHADEQGAD